MNPKHSRLLHNPHRGFGMVEILVAVVIAMLASLVIMQIASTFEAQKRSTSGSADAQTNGAIGLYAVARQAQVAGFGLPLFNSSYKPLSCNPVLQVSAPNGVGTPLFPVLVTNGAGGAPDILTVRGVRLDPPLVPANSLGGIPLVMSVPVAGGVITVGNNMACQTNDVLVVVRNSASGATCIPGRVTSVPAPGQITASGVPNLVGTWAPGSSNDAVICLPNWTRTDFGIDANNQLIETVSLAGNPPPNVLANEVVNMQIQYGIANAVNSPAIAQWVEPTGTFDATALAANPTPLLLVRALRIAVIARNEVQEKDTVTTAGRCTNTGVATLTAADGVCAWQGVAGSDAPVVNIETGNPNWANYRYSVHEMIIPLRNMSMNALSL